MEDAFLGAYGGFSISRAARSAGRSNGQPASPRSEAALFETGARF